MERPTSTYWSCRAWCSRSPGQGLFSFALRQTVCCGKVGRAHQTVGCTSPKDSCLFFTWACITGLSDPARSKTCVIHPHLTHESACCKPGRPFRRTSLYLEDTQHPRLLMEGRHILAPRLQRGQWTAVHGHAEWACVRGSRTKVRFMVQLDPQRHGVFLELQVS